MASSVANPQTSPRRIHSSVSSASLARHAAKCRVCHRPSRAAIEYDLLKWRNPFDLVNSYGSARGNSSRAARKSARLAQPIFEPALLEEISPDEIEHPEQPPQLAKRAAEKLSKAAKAPVPPQNFTIKLSPPLAAAREERRRGLEADRRALEAKNLALAVAHTNSLIANDAQCRAEPKG